MSNENDNAKRHGGGPKTPEGKRRSSLNATRHGLTAETIVLPNEDKDRFEELLDDYVHDFRPATRVELDLVHELVITRWRQMRLWNMEATVLQIGMKRNEQAARDEFQDQLRSNVRTALAFIEMSGDTKAMQLLNRYESRLMRRFHHILSELDRLQAKRKAEESTGTMPALKPVKSVQKIVPNELPAIVPDRHPGDRKPPNQEDAA